jgi:hypothetical protein
MGMSLSFSILLMINCGAKVGCSRFGRNTIYVVNYKRER